MIVIDKKAYLTDELINKWSEEAENIYAQELGVNNAETLKVKLGIEEMLLRFRDCYGTDEPCTLKCTKTRNAVKYMIQQRGLRQNPMDTEETPYFDFLRYMNLNPSYTYHGKQSLNCISLSYQLRKKKNTLLIQLATAVILALIAGNIARYTGSAYLNSTVSLLFKKITTMFSAIATPLVFCAVITEISGIGDAASFGKIGGRLIGRMMITYMTAMTIMVLVGIPMGLAAPGTSSSGADSFTDLLTLVLDMIPENLMSPFMIDNDLQVIVLAIFIGVAMLLLGDKAGRVKDFISDVGEIINKMMLLVCKLLPFFVFLGICDLIISDKLAEVAKVSTILLISFIACVINILIVIIRTRIVTGKTLKELFAPQIPSLLINLTTSSQISALPESMKCCKEGYKIDEKLVDFGLPLGIVVYMPNGAIMLGAMTWVLGTMSHDPADPMTILKIVFVSIVVAIAAPPIPGSAFAIMPILFSACGTDLSMMPLAVIVASTFGYLLPAMNGFCLQEEILMASTKANMIKNTGKD